MRILLFLLFMPFFLTDVVAQDDKFNGKEYGRLDVYKDNLLTHSQPTNTVFGFRGHKMVVIDGETYKTYEAISVKNFDGYQLYDFGNFIVQRHYDYVIVVNNVNEHGEPCHFERMYKVI